MMSIDNPRIDWVSMGKIMGVPSVSVSTAEAFHASLLASASEAGPMLIEVRL
jgi:acetolactate synthase-1/2/3 large subunit